MSNRLRVVVPDGTTITPPAPLTPRLEAALLPWESAAELVALHAELVTEHEPRGPTERHLVEELALLVWRKRRVADAERALHLAVLHDHVDSSYTATKIASRALVCTEMTGAALAVDEAVRSSAARETEDAASIAADEAMTGKALGILAGEGKGAYERALAALHETTQNWWRQQLEEADEPGTWSATAEDLRRFLETEVRDWYARAKQQLAAGPALRRQAYAESLDVDRAQQLQAYDAQLDRRLERALAMLLRLQERTRTLEAIPA
jgi:hypothetical protein